MSTLLIAPSLDLQAPVLFLSFARAWNARAHRNNSTEPQPLDAGGLSDGAAVGRNLQKRGSLRFGARAHQRAHLFIEIGCCYALSCSRK